QEQQGNGNSASASSLDCLSLIVESISPSNTGILNSVADKEHLSQMQSQKSH
ncbi:hypothetical protein SK128_014916, partial [Halocaridina rubra]